MTGAMYAAVAGLKAHMSKLNVIGNNVANANTYGYKAGSVAFTESLYTTVRAGSDGTASLAGNNPSQVGYGCKIGTIDLDMSTKNYVPTGGPLDCMINGDGFFMVGDKNPTNDIVNPESLQMTRVGRFSIDNDGYLVDGNNNVVYGFVTCNTGTDDKKATTAGTKGGGVSTQLVPIRIPYVNKDGDAVYPGVDTTTGKNVYPTAGDAVENYVGLMDRTGVSIDATGQVTAINGKSGDPVVIGYVALASVANPNGMSHTEGPYYKALGGAGKTSVATVGGVVGGKLNNGDLVTDSTEDDILGGLATKLVPNGLESSGTDIATEFSEMITTQRGYQANTRIITVTDSMLEELVNMKR